MPSARTYALPVKPRSTQHSLISTKKRKRDQSSDSEGDAGSDTSGQDQLEAAADFNWASLTAATTEQYRTAGFDPTVDHVPPAPFPHKAISDLGSAKGGDLVISALTPSEHVLRGAHHSQGKNSDTTLRSQHLANLTTLLHRCLAKGDFIRAERAWALLLRSGGESIELKNSVMDVRKAGKWAIAAEIILRRNEDTEKPARLEKESFINLSTQDAPKTLDLDNVRTARRFYERLALQYPASKFRVEQPTDFYLHMYGLWVYEITEQARRALLHVRQADRSNMGDSDQGDEEETGSEDVQSSTALVTTRVRSQEFQDARDLVSSLDEVLIRPPFDKSADLLHLRGMVSLWIADLMQELVVTATRTNSDGIQHQQQLHDCRREREKARSFFVRCTANGGRVADSIMEDFSVGRTIPVLPSSIGRYADLPATEPRSSEDDDSGTDYV